MEIVIGKILDENTADLIKDFTSVQDRSKVYNDTGVGTSTLRDILYRINPITERSIVGIKRLLEIAIENSRIERTKAEQGEKNLLAIFDTI